MNKNTFITLSELFEQVYSHSHLTTELLKRNTILDKLNYQSIYYHCNKNSYKNICEYLESIGKKDRNNAWTGGVLPVPKFKNDDD